MPTFLLEGGVPTIHTLNNTIPLPDGVSVRIQPTEMQRGFGADHPTAVAIIEYGSNVSASIVAAWLYQHLQKHRAKRVRINRKEITVADGNIQKVIEESIQIDQ